ncbi:NACHT domain-containing NTPase, partial [cf. Phormidesmis sp. LEGE 11477]|uniref:NACHT domain-containing protein n=1 Tax=cf. Phormidesmis sp. LEGE 11477 TaxID=1828680 RepID=UPI00187FDDC5
MFLAYSPVEADTLYDSEELGWLIRESFTSALLFDRAVHSNSFQLDEKIVRLSQQLEPGIRLAIVGDPGCGKTTLLTYVTYHYAVRQLPQSSHYKLTTNHQAPISREHWPKHQWIPITLTCRDLLNFDFNEGLLSLVVHQLKYLGYEKKIILALSSLIEDRSSNDRVLLLVDGLDEIPSEEQRLAFSQMLVSQATLYPELTIIITSRIVGFSGIQS